MMDIYLIVNVLIALSLLLLAVVSISREGYKNSVNRLFTFFSILVAIWIIANFFSNSVAAPAQVALIANYVVFSSSLAVVIILLQFVIKLAGAKKLETTINRLLPLLWIICVVSATPLLVESIYQQGEVYAIKFGPAIWAYGITLFLMIGAIVFSLFYGLKHNKGFRKRQIKIITFGLGVSIPLVLLFSFIIPSVTGDFLVTEFGITPIIVLVICIYYSVVRYRLFDIKLAAVRTSTYVLALLTLALIYYFLASLISGLLFRFEGDSYFNISPVNIILTLGLAFVFQPIKRFFDKITNFVFYRHVYDDEEFFARFSRKLSTITDLRVLLQYTSSEISTTLNASYGAFLVYRNEERVAYATTNDRHKRIPAGDTEVLDQYVKRHGKKIIITDILSDSHDSELRRLLVGYKIGLVLPIVQGTVSVGYIFLGEHLGSQYTSRDVKTLNKIVDELLIAIQNTLSIQEVKELNENLHQRIDAATKELRRSNAQLKRLDESKDEFISMASHQLRTPLTSIKGYISMLIEGDIGKITPEQEHVLSEAFMSSERMVRLISDFLNVSRLQTGKFIIEKYPIDLAKLVQREIESLEPNATARGLKFVYKLPKNLPVMELDENKIQQVVMNFCDNAIFYSKEKGTVTISLKKVPGWVELTVEDDGIGVPQAEQAHLFNKFFRAANAKQARPDGTGVGLFLAKKVIDEHDGEIIFESKEGKGSTFGFRLPLPEAVKKK